MGLDVYVLHIKSENAINDFEIKMPQNIQDNTISKKIAYWHKDPYIHEWMENLYFEKGGNGIFNDQFLKISKNDLHNLEILIKGHAIPNNSSYIEFIKKSRDVIDSGDAVYCYSVW